MMQINELAVGINLTPGYAQAAYYAAAMKEPVLLSLKEGEEETSFLPMMMYRKQDGQWQLGDGGGAELTEEIKGIYEKITQEEEQDFGENSVDPEKILLYYLGCCIRLLSEKIRYRKLRITVTSAKLLSCWSRLEEDTREILGIERKELCIQDHLTSFYYYAVSRKKELWQNDVALLEYEEECMNGYVLHIDDSTRPAIAGVTLAARQPVTKQMQEGWGKKEWEQEKDRLFFELLKKLQEGRRIQTSYLVSNFYSQTWAKRSIAFLCSKGHTFQGKNLYVLGACYAAAEKEGMTGKKGILYQGKDMVTVNLGMDMKIRGKENYYPLVQAGTNWYDVYHVCEFIPDEERFIQIQSKSMRGGEVTTHLLSLTHMQNRPSRTLRIRMTVYFTSPSCCHIEAEDLGFGELVPSSGRHWERDILFYPDAERRSDI